MWTAEHWHNLSSTEEFIDILNLLKSTEYYYPFQFLMYGTYENVTFKSYEQ